MTDSLVNVEGVRCEVGNVLPVIDEVSADESLFKVPAPKSFIASGRFDEKTKDGQVVANC